MIKRLVGIRLSSLVSSMKSKKADGTKKPLPVWKILLFALLFLYLGGAFVFLFTMMAIGFGMLLIPNGQDAMYYGMFMLIAFSVVFIFSIFETKSELFDCRDNELLLAMPIKPSHIVISRIITVLIYNYIEMALIFLPSVVVYAILGGSPLGIVGGVLAYLLLPLLSTALSSGVGYILALITKKLKNKTIFTTVISLFFLVLYMVVYTGFVGNVGEMEEDMMVNILEIPVIAAIGSAATLNPISTTVFVLVSIFAAYSAYAIISKSYISIVTSKVSAEKAVFKKEKLKKRSAVLAITLKELRRLFTSSAYLLNASMGAVFAPIIAVMALIYRADIKAMLSEIPFLSGALAPMLTAALTFMAFMIIISASSLSLEGKSFWIIKSMPLSGRDVLLGKTIPHVIFGAPVLLVSSVILAIATEASATDLPFMIIIPQLANIVSALFGIIINTAFPKFEYENEAQPLKQSLAMTVVMFSGMIFGILISGVSVALSIFASALVANIVVSALLLALAIGLYFILIGPSARRYERL